MRAAAGDARGPPPARGIQPNNLQPYRSPHPSTYPQTLPSPHTQAPTLPHLPLLINAPPTPNPYPLLFRSTHRTHFVTAQLFSFPYLVLVRRVRSAQSVSTSVNDTTPIHPHTPASMHGVQTPWHSLRAKQICSRLLFALTTPLSPIPSPRSRPNPLLAIPPSPIDHHRRPSRPTPTLSTIHDHLLAHLSDTLSRPSQQEHQKYKAILFSPLASSPPSSPTS